MKSTSKKTKPQKPKPGFRKNYFAWQLEDIQVRELSRKPKPRT